MDSSLIMHKEPFLFKEFRLYHQRCAHKIGTDSMVLGAWAKPSKKRGQALDIGSGCGILSFMLLQNYPEFCFTAIEPDVDSFLDLTENIDLQPGFNIKGFNLDLATFKTDKLFDLIISNPPFYDNTYPGLNNKRAGARHSGFSLSIDSLVDFTALHLSADGDFFIIIPLAGMDAFEKKTSSEKLHIHKKLHIFSEENELIRCCYHLKKSGVVDASQIGIEKLVIREKGRYTEDYKTFTKRFHGVEL